MAKKRAIVKKVKAKSRTKSRSKAKQRDTYALMASYLGDKQFPRGARVRVMFLPKVPNRVECLGKSHKGKTVCKFVEIHDLGDLRIEWDGTGHKRDSVAKALGIILAQRVKSK